MRKRSIGELLTMLRRARRRVRAIERALDRARSEQTDTCDHVWVKRFPSGMRDNGEYDEVCIFCGAVE